MAPGAHWLKVLTLTKNAITQRFSLVKNLFCQKMSKTSPPIGSKLTQWRHRVYKGTLFRDLVRLQTSYNSCQLQGAQLNLVDLYQLIEILNKLHLTKIQLVTDENQKRDETCVSPCERFYFPLCSSLFNYQSKGVCPLWY